MLFERLRLGATQITIPHQREFGCPMCQDAVYSNQLCTLCRDRLVASDDNDVVELYSVSLMQCVGCDRVQQYRETSRGVCNACQYAASERRRQESIERQRRREQERLEMLQRRHDQIAAEQARLRELQQLQQSFDMGEPSCPQCTRGASGVLCPDCVRIIYHYPERMIDHLARARCTSCGSVQMWRDMAGTVCGDCYDLGERGRF